MNNIDLGIVTNEPFPIGMAATNRIISYTKDLDLLIKKESIGKLTNDKELNSLLDFSNKIYSPVNSSVLNKIIREVS